MRDQLALVVEPAIEFGTIKLLKIVRETEVMNDFPSEGQGLRGAKNKTVPAAPEAVERIEDAVIGPGPEYSPATIGRAVKSDGFLDGIVVPKQLREALTKRRTDDPSQVPLGGDFALKLSQRVLHGADDARGGVNQRAVQIEEDEAR